MKLPFHSNVRKEYEGTGPTWQAALDMVQEAQSLKKYVNMKCPGVSFTLLWKFSSITYNDIMNPNA